MTCSKENDARSIVAAVLEGNGIASDRLTNQIVDSLAKLNLVSHDPEPEEEPWPCVYGLNDCDICS